jgi:hypothetical protein
MAEIEAAGKKWLSYLHTNSWYLIYSEGEKVSEISVLTAHAPFTRNNY